MSAMSFGCISWWSMSVEVGGCHFPASQIVCIHDFDFSFVSFLLALFCLIYFIFIWLLRKEKMMRGVRVEWGRECQGYN